MGGVEGHIAEGAPISVRQGELRDGYILGFRAWKMEANPHLKQLYSQNPEGVSYSEVPNYQPLFLKAVWTEDFWPQATKEAECEITYDDFWQDTIQTPSLKSRVPHRNCECGLYACYSLQDLLKIKKRADNEVALVFGVVIGSGKVQIHKDGFRAEYMRIVTLIKNPYAHLTPDYMFHLQDISQRYQIPLTQLKDIPKAVSQLGGKYDVVAQSVAEEAGGVLSVKVVGKGSAIPVRRSSSTFSKVIVREAYKPLTPVPDVWAAIITLLIIVIFVAVWGYIFIIQPAL